MSNKINNLYEFDEYLLNVEERSLWKEDELLKIPPKVFDTLRVLVENRGEVLSKESLMNAVWEEAFVEESNLSQNIYTLRQLFGSDKKYIKTVPKQGYVFDAPVKHSSIEKAEITQETGNGNSIVATQTRTRIIEEGYVDEALPPPRDSVSRNKWIGGLLAALLLAALGYAGYTFYKPGVSNSGSKRVAKFNVRALTDTGVVRYPMISRDGKQLAYVRPDGAKLYLRNLETNAESEVSVDEGYVPGYSTFSPDGESIYFRTRKRETDPANVYKISASGGKAELVIKDVWGHFGLSQDGTKAAFFRADVEKKRFDLIVKDLETGNETIVNYKELPLGYNWGSHPAWSYDGKKIAVVQRATQGSPGKLIVIDVDTQTEQLVEAEGLKDILQAVWMPGDNELLTLSTAEKKIYQIFRVSYPGGETTRFTNDLREYRSLSISDDGKYVAARTQEIYSNIWVLPEGDAKRKVRITEGEYGIAGLFGLSWTPEGKIVYFNRGETTSQIRIIDPADNQSSLLAENSDGVNHFPHVAPDGKSVFFQSTEKGKLKVKRVNIKEQKTTLLNPNGDQSEMFPVVSPDNEWVYFIRGSKKKSGIYRKSLETGKSETIFDETEFSPASFLSISPDGKYLAFNYVEKRKGKDKDKRPTGVKMGFIDLENGFKLTTRKFPIARPYLQWTNGGKTFDYFTDSKAGGKLWRRNVDGEEPPKLVTELPGEKFYYFSWSRDEKDLAASIGFNKGNAILFDVNTPRDSES